MAAGIQTRDVQVGIEMAWHKLTHVKPSIDKSNSEIVYPMHKEQLQTSKGVPTEFYICVCEDDGKPAGSPVGPDYSLIDNSAIWDMTANALGGTKHTIVSCGTVCDRSKGFISVKLDANFMAAGRNTESVLNVIWGHGGKCSVIARTGITVVVCSNTMAMALGRKGEFNFNVRHTGQAMAKLEGMSKAIDAHCGVVAEFQKTMAEFANQSVKEAVARGIYAGFVVRNDEPEKVSTRAQNQIEALTTLFNRGLGNTGKDFADVLNATTDYYTHTSSGGENRWKQMESSEFGMGNARKTEMYKLLKGDDVYGLGDLNEVQKRGQRILQMV